MKIINILVCLFIITSTSCTNSNKKSAHLTIAVSKIEMEKGKQIYRAKCMNCHRKNGKGLNRVYPPLANSDFLEDKLEDAIRMVKYGSGEQIKVNGKKYKSYMPASGLKEKEMKLVFNYILNAWGNEYGIVDEEIIKNIKAKK